MATIVLRLFNTPSYEDCHSHDVIIMIIIIIVIIIIITHYFIFHHCYRFSVVVNCIAERRPDVVDKEPEKTNLLNVEAAEVIATAATEVSPTGEDHNGGGDDDDGGVLRFAA